MPKNMNVETMRILRGVMSVRCVLYSLTLLRAVLGRLHDYFLHGDW